MISLQFSTIISSSNDASLATTLPIQKLQFRYFLKASSTAFSRGRVQQKCPGIQPSRRRLLGWAWVGMRQVNLTWPWSTVRVPCRPLTHPLSGRLPPCSGRMLLVDLTLFVVAPEETNELLDNAVFRPLNCPKWRKFLWAAIMFIPHLRA